MAEKDIEVREKQEVQTQAESTRNIPVYVPAVDIYESEEALTVVADMPGVAPENVDIDLRDDQLTIRGTVTVEGDGETVLLREYGVGDYYRQFTLGPDHRSVQDRGGHEGRGPHAHPAQGGQGQTQEDHGQDRLEAETKAGPSGPASFYQPIHRRLFAFIRGSLPH